VVPHRIAVQYDAVESAKKPGEGPQVIQAVIFDMDGLLVDSEPVWFEARRELLARFAKVWTDADQERQMGVRTSVWVEYVTEKLGGAMSRDDVLSAVVRIMADSYERGNVPILPGAAQALEYCVGRYRVGLASGSPRVLIDAALKGAGWNRYFEQVVSSDECERGKPAPDVYLAIMSSMGLDPATTAVVEDSPAGILAGKAAGAKAIAVPGGYTSPDNEALQQADAVIESLHSLPQTIAEL
jgi:HAD superfamily hydrolase (TIGR01509 family)